ncbi:MAG: type VI secretion system tip protein VgrG [Desulfobacterales bacterium]|nr:type VI secretion system tip protein VgrG [Desulfobacterales bacterium]
MYDEKIYLNVTTPLDSAKRKFFLNEIHGSEEISNLFCYNLKMSSFDEQVDFSAMLGKNITVNIAQNDGNTRYINGVVTSFSQGGSLDKYAVYYAEINPWLYQLTLNADNKIFQEKSVIDIITGVFSDLGFTDFSNKTTGSYQPREYCVQYNETSFDFVSRLMEEEGIFYFFEHTDSKHTLVFADDSSAHKAIPGFDSAKIRWGEFDREDFINFCTFGEQLVTKKYALKDYHFETPETDLSVSADGATTTGSLSIYEYPGIYTQTSDGEGISKKRIEAHEFPMKVLKGESLCKLFISGYKFTLAEHKRSDMNRAYVLEKVSIMADQKKYVNTFEAFPDDVPYRPIRKTKRAKIFGSQTAVVVGKSGEEIWPDKYGRVKVQFHWDKEGKKDENSSCWIRVAQFWAGKNWGTMFIPRMGTEVIVSFLEGNPDKPLIIGTVYNATQTLPYGQPDNKNISTIKTISTKQGAAGNEIKFDDTKDAELFHLHAQKDMTVKVENDRTTEILNNETTTITKNRTVTIKEEHETLTVEKGNRTVDVQKGTETHSVKDTRSLTVEGAETHTNKDKFTHTVKGDYSLTIDGKLTIKVKGDITIKTDKNYKSEAGQAIENKSGTAFTNKAGTALTNKAGTALENKAGTSLTNKAGTSLENNAGTSLTNKASMSLTNDAGMTMTNKGGISLENKGSATQTVDGGGMLTLKGGVIMVG